MQNTTQQDEILNAIKSLQNTRGSNHKQKLKLLTEEVLKNFQRRQLITFSRDTINALFSGAELNDRVMRKYVLEVLTELKQNNKIKEDEIKQVSYAFRVKPLVTFDSGSYAVLMANNGYMPYIVTDGYTEQYPEFLNNLTGRHGNKARLFKNSYKPRSKQGVYSGSNVSIARDKIEYYRKVYTLI